MSIRSGVLSAGTRLPSSRDLAEALGVARNTVVLAFDELYAQGFLDARVGAGTFVADGFQSIPTAEFEVDDTLGEPTISSRGRLMSGLALNRRHQYSTVRAFRAGVPALDSFSLQTWRDEASKVQRWSNAKLFGYGDPQGYWPLREAVAHYLGATRAVRCAPEQVVITSGSQQGLDLCARLLLDRGAKVLMEDPARSGAFGAMAAAELDLVPVPVDQDGMRLHGSGARDAEAVYVSPSHQYPLAVTMSRARRAEVVDWACATNAWIIEDDFDSEFRYEGVQLPSIQGAAPGRTAYIGSFSRAVFPSLRIGYVVVPPRMAEPFQHARSLLDRQSPMWEQATLARFITEGHLDRHLRRMRAVYAARRDALMEYGERHLGGLLHLRDTSAGLHLTGELVNGMSGMEAERRAAAEGIDVLAVSRLCRGAAVPEMLLLGFGVVAESAMEAGVTALRTALADPHD